MNARIISSMLPVLAVLGMARTAHAAPLGTAFTYQGQLQQNGTPTSDTCDFYFNLFDAPGSGSPPTGGTKLGTDQAITNVTVTDGVFTVLLNGDGQFGPNAFAGENRWLQIGVTCPATGSQSFTTLTPRQPLTAAPYALYAPKAGSARDVSCRGCIGADDLADGAVTVVKIADGVGDVTAVTAGDGLSGGGISGDVALGVNFAGSGNATSAARSDHNHFGQSWSGAVAGRALQILNTATDGKGIQATADNGVGAFGLFGQSAAGTGVWGSSHSGTGVLGSSDSGFAGDFSGKVRVNGFSSIARLSVNSNPPALNAGLSLQQGYTSQWSVATVGADGDFVVFEDDVNANRLTIKGGGPDEGNVGVGTTSPGSALTVKGRTGTDSLEILSANGNQAFLVAGNGNTLVGRGLGITELGVATASHLCHSSVFNIVSSCSSAAEYVPTTDAGGGYPEAGDLVRVAPAAKNPYGDSHSPFVATRTTKPCDPDLLGFLLKPELGADGEKLNDHYLPLAIYGYFPAKVTLENGPIKRGDPITSSSKAGYGMKATQACKVIGYALQDADKEGTVQVFAHLSERTAPEVAQLRAQVQELQQENAQVRAQVQQVLDQVQALQGRLPAVALRSQ